MLNSSNHTNFITNKANSIGTISFPLILYTSHGNGRKSFRESDMSKLTNFVFHPYPLSFEQTLILGISRNLNPHFYLIYHYPLYPSSPFPLPFPFFLPPFLFLLHPSLIIIISYIFFPFGHFSQPGNAHNVYGIEFV